MNMKKYIIPENWIHGMSLERKGLLKSQQRCKPMPIRLLRWITIIAITAMFCTTSLRGQTYTVGDTVDNFGSEICVNGEGYWDYNTDGLHKIVWMNLFTSW